MEPYNLPNQENRYFRNALSVCPNIYDQVLNGSDWIWTQLYFLVVVDISLQLRD